MYGRSLNQRLGFFHILGSQWTYIRFWRQQPPHSYLIGVNSHSRPPQGLRVVCATCLLRHPSRTSSLREVHARWREAGTPSFHLVSSLYLASSVHFVSSSSYERQLLIDITCLPCSIRVWDRGGATPLPVAMCPTVSSCCVMCIFIHTLFPHVTSCVH